MKLEANLPLFCYLIDPVKIRTEGYGGYDNLINRIDTRLKRVLLLPRVRSNNYLCLSRENMAENKLYLKALFMIRLREISKLMFHEHPSCPNKICAEH